MAHLAMLSVLLLSIKKSDNPEDKIIEGGRQPMACDHTKERFCDDGLAIRTNSTNEEVTDFYTYLVMNLK